MYLFFENFLDFPEKFKNFCHSCNDFLVVASSGHSALPAVRDFRMFSHKFYFRAFPQDIAGEASRAAVCFFKNEKKGGNYKESQELSEVRIAVPVLSQPLDWAQESTNHIQDFSPTRK